MTDQFLILDQEVDLSDAGSTEESKTRKSSAQQIQQENQEKIARTVVDAVLDSTTIFKVVDERMNIGVDVKNSEDEFSSMIEELREYKKKHGDCIVPLTYPTNPKLVRWCIDLRDNRRWFYQGRVTNLDVKKIKVLDDLGFVWDDARWLDMYVRLKQYKAEHGDVLVPNRYPKDKQLGQWVSKQRQRYRMMRQGLLQGKPVSSSQITPERVAMLEDLGMVWDARPIQPSHEYMESTDNESSSSVGDSHYEGNQVSSSDHYLNEPNADVKNDSFEVIRPSYDEQWNIMFDRLMKYKRKFDHVMVPNRYKEDPPLGQWVSRQRQQYRLLKHGKKKSTLTQERIQKLENSGFVWDGRCARSNGNLRFFPGRGISTVDEAVVAARIDGQVLNDQLQNCYVTYDQQWQTMFERLVQFKTKYGHCLVPNRYEDDKQLGQWVSRQRRHYRLLQEEKNSNMTLERIQQLEKIGFIWSARDVECVAMIDPTSMNEVDELRYAAAAAAAAVENSSICDNDDGVLVTTYVLQGEGENDQPSKEGVNHVMLEVDENQQLSSVLDDVEVVLEDTGVSQDVNASGDESDEEDNNKPERWRLLLDAAVQV